MKILHILNDGTGELPERIIEIQSKDNEVNVIDLQKKEVSYDGLVDEIFSHERVISS
jgi:hypothetical protein